MNAETDIHSRELCRKGLDVSTPRRSGNGMAACGKADAGQSVHVGQRQQEIRSQKTARFSGLHLLRGRSECNKRAILERVSECRLCGGHRGAFTTTLSRNHAAWLVLIRPTQVWTLLDHRNRKPLVLNVDNGFS